MQAILPDAYGKFLPSVLASNEVSRKRGRMIFEFLILWQYIRVPRKNLLSPDIFREIAKTRSLEEYLTYENQ
jgi:hypothetical protein